MTTPSRQPSIYTDTGEDQEDASPAAKRRRVAAACDQCRSKKIKCDAIRPGSTTLIPDFILSIPARSPLLPH